MTNQSPIMMLDTENLILRPFTDADAPAFTEAALESIACVGKWMSWCNASFSEEVALQWFATCNEARATGVAEEFGIFCKESGTLLGGIGLNSINRQHLFCNFGYWVRHSYQRRGIAQQASRAVIEFAFSKLGLNRLEIVVAAGNLPSEHLALKLGAKKECVAEKRLVLHGIAVSATVFSLITQQNC